MKTGLRILMAVILGVGLARCATPSKQGGVRVGKYNPVKIYNAPYKKVYEAAKQAILANNYVLEVEHSDPEEGSGTLVTGYILAPSTVHFYTDDKGQKKPCQVKYLIHADLRAVDENRTKLELLIPESTELHKPKIGPMWQKTETMQWRGEKIQADIAAILAGKSIIKEPAPAKPPQK